MRQILVLLCVSAFCPPSSSPSSAADLSIRVVDARDQSPLPGATLAVLGVEFGGHADGEGHCKIRGLPPGSYDVLCSYVGYRSQILRGVEAGGEKRTVALEPSTVELPGVVVSAVRRSQTFAEAPISISVVQTRHVAAHNALSLEAPLRYVSGVSQVGSAVNIRGSSGFSRGTGSRVLMLVDGFPLLSADLGDIKWDAIPVDQVERIEIVKGAGSALYGTGALGGVINVLTRDPLEDPGTRFRLLGGFYSQPAHRQWRWTEDPMYVTGIDLSHSRVMGSTGLVLSGGHKRSAGYHENDDFRRYHLYAKAVRRSSAASYWRLMANWALDDHGVFIQWRNRNQPLHVSDGDGPANTASWKAHLNTEYYRLLRRDLGYRLKLAYYRTGFANNSAAGSLRSDGHKISGESQFDFTGWRGWKLTLGGVGALDLVRAPGDFLGERAVQTMAGYAQGAYPLNQVAEMTVGLRYDWNRRGASRAQDGGLCPPLGALPARKTSEFSPQVGLSFRPLSTTAFRASGGRGFRAPSVSEVFAQAQVSGLQVCANPGLGPERSWSYEVGVRQEVGGRTAVDMALFWNTYRGLIEGRPDIRGGGGIPVARFRNLSRARVMGLEVEALAALPLGLRGRAAYTLVDGVEELAATEILPPYCHDGYQPGSEAPLPYRSRHVFNAGLEAGRGLFSGGVNFQYLSRFERVSGLFSECGRDQVPIYLVDAYLSWPLGGLRFNFRIDNLLQYHYATTEREIRPLRRFSLSVDGDI